MSATHVAVIRPGVAESLLCGTKRIESRFSRQRRAPYGQIRTGDVVHFKLSGGDIIGTSRVSRVREYCDLTSGKIEGLRRRFGDAIQAPDSYWSQRRDCRFGVLIWLRGIYRSRRVIPVPRLYGSGWITLPDR